MTKKLMITTAIALLSWAPGYAFGQATSSAGAVNQDNSSDIVVTAQRREERSRDVPITITTLNSAQLETANVESLADTMKVTPALRFDSVANFAQPTIRGIGTAVSTAGGGPNVGIYVDGFFQSNPLVADFELMNVKNIQVLKGPQGTLFGRNTTGGAIIVSTNDPSVMPAAQFKASYGRFNDLDLQGYATTGITDRIALDVEGRFSRGDGYRTNIVNGDHDVGAFENWSVRTGLKAELSDSISVLLRYSHSKTQDPTRTLANAYVDRSGKSGFLSLVSPTGRAVYGRTGSEGLPLIYFYAPQGTYATDPDEVAFTDRVDFTNNSDAVQGTISVDLGIANMTSFTQYRWDDSVNYTDLDSTALPFFYLRFPVTNRSFSQEFLFNSKGGSRLQWVAGLAYYQNRDTWDLTASFGGSPLLPFGGSSATARSYAAFADLTYEITPQLFITAGARYSHDLVRDAYFKTNAGTVSYEGPNGVPVSTAGLAPNTPIFLDTLKNDRLTPRFVIRFKPNEQSSIYASYTKGYKAGIYNVGGMSAVPVEPEDINAFEVGYKLAANGLSLDLAGYYYDYKNLQVSSFQAGTAQIRNAASSEIYGLEAQFSYRFSQAFSINGGGAWTHARYKSFPNAPFVSYCDPVAPVTSPLWCVPQALGGFGPGALTQTIVNAKGFRMQRAPEFTGNVGASYRTDFAGGSVTLSGNLYYTSAFYFDATQQFRQRGYEILSARVQWQDPRERFTVALYGDNLTNNRHLDQVISNTIGTGAGWNSPTTYGISLGAKF